MADEDRMLPVALGEVHELGFFEDHDGYDFQPVGSFDWSVETTGWWHAWTGNAGSGTAPFRVFGRDGSGGRVAFWARMSGETIESQPIVFLGSEGELCVVARNLDDYLWLLANGVGPLEMVEGLHRVPERIPVLVAFAQRHTGASARSLKVLISAAEAELPALTSFVDSVTR